MDSKGNMILFSFFVKKMLSLCKDLNWFNPTGQKRDGPLKTQSVNKTLPESSMNDDEAPSAN